MNAIKKHLPIFFIAILFHCSSVLAKDDQERDELYRLHQELTYLEKMVERAKGSASDSDTTQFDYSSLEVDLGLITQGILDYLRDERREPYVIENVSGEYHIGR